MKLKVFLFSILIVVVLSGCLEEGSVYITSTDVMYSQDEDGTKLTVTPYIRNDKDTDTGKLTARIKIREPSTNLIVAEKDSDIGYIKSKSSTFNSVSLKVSDPGEYMVEVEVLEGGKILTQSAAPVTIKAKPGPGTPSDIKLTDMNIVITKLLNDATIAVVDVSPGLYNQGGDSNPLNLEVTAQIDPYNTYVQSDTLNIIKSEGRVRGKVTFTIPRNKEYAFSVKVLENGRTVAQSKLVDKIKLNTLKYNEPGTYILVEEGKPISTQTPTEPGLPAGVALIGILLVYYIISRRRG
ncbi:MAG TPA: hypothetical protein VN368_02525 [Candidatus Methylomirabilis sp.]|nr:hypothetical protein [Candidatus Methylomirabilis sp.]